MAKSFDLKILAEKWPSAFVARQEICKLTGGIINPKYLANLDSKGLGPKGRLRIGRKIVYPVSSIIEWLESRASVIG